MFLLRSLQFGTDPILWIVFSEQNPLTTYHVIKCEAQSHDTMESNDSVYLSECREFFLNSFLSIAIVKRIFFIEKKNRYLKGFQQLAISLTF